MQKAFLSKEQKKIRVFINSTTPGGWISKYDQIRFDRFACDSSSENVFEYKFYITAYISALIQK